MEKVKELEVRKKALKSLFNRALVIVVVIYAGILAFDIMAQPRYPAWLVGIFTIVGFLLGTGNGFAMGFRVRFATVMKGRSDKEIISDIQTDRPRGIGIDDEE